MNAPAPRSPALGWAHGLVLVPLLPLLLAAEECKEANPKVPDCPEQLQVAAWQEVVAGEVLNLQVGGWGDPFIPGEVAIRVNPLGGLAVPAYTERAQKDADRKRGATFAAVHMPGGESIDQGSDTYGKADGYHKNESGQTVAAVREYVPMCRAAVADGTENTNAWRRYPSRKFYFLIDKNNAATMATYQQYLDVYNGGQALFGRGQDVNQVSTALRINAVEASTVLGESGTEVRVYVQNVKGIATYISKDLLKDVGSSYTTSLLINGESVVQAGEGARWAKGESLLWQTFKSQLPASTLLAQASGHDIALTFNATDGEREGISQTLRPVPSEVLAVLSDVEADATADKAGRRTILLNPDPTADPALPQNWCYTKGAATTWARPAGSSADEVVLCGK